MKVGIFGTPDDAQCLAVARELRALGAEDLLFEDDALERSCPVSIRDGQMLYRGHDVTSLDAAYLRSVPAPWVPALARDDELVLHEDWFIQYMRSREHASFYMAWLLALQARGTRLVNGPHGASVMQYKPFQLDTFRRIGAPIPRTLISNDPDEVRRFQRSLSATIFKPLMGGALTQPLDANAMEAIELIRASPVIFQERIDGDDIRVMLVGSELISSVAIRTPQQHLDFRDDPVYSGGDAAYEPVILPPSIVRWCREAAEQCGLLFAGIDLKRTASGDFVFLELNSSPIYLDVELKLGHPISRAIALLLVGAAKVRGRL